MLANLDIEACTLECISAGMVFSNVLSYVFSSLCVCALSVR
jgi:hypothetical protein